MGVLTIWGGQDSNHVIKNYIVPLSFALSAVVKKHSEILLKIHYMEVFYNQTLIMIFMNKVLLYEYSVG